MKKRIFTFIIAIALIFSLAVPCFADEDYTNKIYILHSNDVHGAIDGYAKMAAYREQLISKGAEVLIVDAGDFSQGQFEVGYTKGADAVKLMNAVGYNVVTLGNHEFDFGYAQLQSNLSQRNFAVVCSNIFLDGGTLFDGSSYCLTSRGVNLGFIGVATPETQTKANPSLVSQFTFLTNDTTPRMYDVIQDEVSDLNTQCDLVIALSHLGVDPGAAPYRSTDLYENVSGIDFIIDGHSHTVIEPGPSDDPIQSTGTAFANIGVIVIDADTKTIIGNYLKPVSEIEATNARVEALAQEIHEKVDAALGSVIATSEVTLNGDKAPGNRTEETNHGDFITDAMLWSLTEQYPGSIRVPEDHIVALTNGGGIRAKIEPGEVKVKDIKTVLPFGNTMTVIYVKGSMLLEALEASTYCVPTAVGGFPQVSGMKYTIDLTKEFDANDSPYPGSTFYGPKTIKRVTINDIGGKPFDPEDTYAVITNNFISAGGDTYYTFSTVEDQYDTSLPLDDVVIDYITEKLGGRIPADPYAQPQGRIIIKTEAEEEDPVSPPTFDANSMYVFLMLTSVFVIAILPPKRKEV